MPAFAGMSGVAGLRSPLRQCIDLGICREAAKRLLGKLGLAVDRDLEYAAARADELDIGLTQL
jgi:hypothetical protein